MGVDSERMQSVCRYCPMADGSSSMSSLSVGLLSASTAACSFFQSWGVYESTDTGGEIGGGGSGGGGGGGGGEGGGRGTGGAL